MRPCWPRYPISTPFLVLAKGRLHTKLINKKINNDWSGSPHPKPGVGIQNLGVDTSRPSECWGLLDRGREREGVLAGVEEGGGRDAVVECRDVRGVDQHWTWWGGHVVAGVLGRACRCRSSLVAGILRIPSRALHQGARHCPCSHSYRQGGVNLTKLKTI